MRAIVDSFNELVLGRRCIGCDSTPGVWCRACADSAGPSAWLVPRVPCPAPVLRVARYDGPIKSAVLAYKDGRSPGLGNPLGQALADALIFDGPHDLLHGSVVLVPIPSAPQRVRISGIDHARSLARAAARALRSSRVDAVARPLLRQRATGSATSDQGHRSARDRVAQMPGTMAFAGGTLGYGRHARICVIVVDDVLTTGATMAEGMRVLRAAELPVRVGLVLASGAPAQGQTGTVLGSGCRDSTTAASVSGWHPPGSVVALTASVLPTSRCQPQAKRST